MLVEDMIDLKPSSLVTLSTSMSLHEVRATVTDHAGVSLFPVIKNDGCVCGFILPESIKAVTKWPDQNFFINLQWGVVRGQENAMVLLNHFEHSELALVYVLDKENRLLGVVRRDSIVSGAIRKSLEYIPVPEIFDALHDAIIIIDNTGTIIYLNHSYSKLLGVPARKIVGRKMLEVEPSSGCLAVLRGAMPLVNERLHIQSLNIDVVATITPIYHDGELKGVISVFRDLQETMRLSTELERMVSVANYLQHQLDQKNTPLPEFKNIIGTHPAFKHALTLAARVAVSNVPVMIRGENGVGKEIIANAIHKASKRRDKPMIRVNCAAIPEFLLESELFGYEEGAFTGAKRGGKIGKFEMAHGGTLFLDEVGDMNLSMQVKILRAIQEKEIERVGGTKAIPVDIRIISATNRNLELLIQNNSFREDLYYRLNVVTIGVPPLRERKEDILLFADYFIDLYAETQGKTKMTLSEKVKQRFNSYHWPGNVRELQNVLQHAVILCEGPVITVEDLPPYLRHGQDNQAKPNHADLNLRTVLDQTEKDTILLALEQAHNNKSLAMRLLGIHRRSFYDKLKKHGVIP